MVKKDSNINLYFLYRDNIGLTHKKNVLSLIDYSKDEINQIILTASNIKNNKLKLSPMPFEKKTGVLIFEKPSLRTRITFETAIYELGGFPIYLSSEQIQMGKRESIKDVAKNLERWVHLIIARTFLHKTVAMLAINSSIPVINALSDKFHPCQALAFGLTIREKLNDKKKINVVFIGDGNNVCNSIMVLSAKLGWNFIACGPKGYQPDSKILYICKEISKLTGSKIEIFNNPQKAVQNADVIYTDVWTSMGQEKERALRRKIFAPYQVNSKLLLKAPKEVIVSHCLPAHRGEEITDDVLDSSKSVALDEAENRLHVQKAAIINLFS
jgi:ornithine carbamoyltransferase